MEVCISAATMVQHHADVKEAGMVGLKKRRDLSRYVVFQWVHLSSNKPTFQ